MSLNHNFNGFEWNLRGIIIISKYYLLLYVLAQFTLICIKSAFKNPHPEVLISNLDIVIMHIQISGA